MLLILDFVLGTILVYKGDPESPSSLEWLLSWGFAIGPIKTFINTDLLLASICVRKSKFHYS